MKCKLSLVIIPFLIHSLLWADDELPAPPDPLDHPETLLEGEGGPLVDAAVLLYFANLESQQEAAAVLLGMVERLGQTGDPRAAPVLAAVLNRPGVYERTTPYGSEGLIQSHQSRIVRNVLRVSATEAWFDLMWPEMTDEQRVNAVLNTMRPDPEIRLLLTEKVLERAKEVAEPLRGAFYDQLLDPKVEYDWRHGWTLNLHSAIGQLMREFPPTDEQQAAIMASDSTLVRYTYLNVHETINEAWAIDLFSQLMEENAERHVVLAFITPYANASRHQPENIRGRYRSILLKCAYALLEDIRADRIDHWSVPTLFSISHILFNLEKHDDTLELFLTLDKFFATYNPEQAALSELLKQRLPHVVQSGMEVVEFRINLWTNDDDDVN